MRPVGSPILDLNPPKGVARSTQKANLDLLTAFNKAHAGKHPHHGDLKARMEAYQLAYRMQDQVLKSSMSITGSNIPDMYGIGNKG